MQPGSLQSTALVTIDLFSYILLTVRMPNAWADDSD